MNVVEKIMAEIKKLSPAEESRLVNRLAEKQMKSVKAVRVLLDTEKYVRYRDLIKAICGGVTVDARLIMESDTFEDFVQRVEAKLIVRDPFPSQIPGSANVALFESYHVSLEEVSRYIVLSDKTIIMNPTAKQMFIQMHQDLVAAAAEEPASASTVL